MISTLAWVPKGVARQVPLACSSADADVEAFKTRLGFTSESFDEAAKAEKQKKVKASGPVAEEPTPEESRRELSDEEIAKLYGLDDIEDRGGQKKDLDVEEDEADAMANLAGLAGNDLFYKDGQEDPNIMSESDEDASEAGDLEIGPEDLLIIAGLNDEETNVLEVHLYEEKERNMFVHHDFPIPSFPLSVAWTDVDPTHPAERGHFVAVGSMDPGIDIYNLDVIDSLVPTATLGGFAPAPATAPESASSSKKKSSKKAAAKKGVLKEGSHSDAVISLAWNAAHRQLLASGSADKTVKLWDLTTQKCLFTSKHHTDKVQAVHWNPSESNIILSASFDRSACVVDGRAPSAVARFALTADAEVAQWNPVAPQTFFVSTEDGSVRCFDVRRTGGAPLFTIGAHDSACTALSINPIVPGLLATGSTDKSIKIWDISGAAPSLVVTKPTGAAVFAIAFCKESPYLLVHSGARERLQIWHTYDNVDVRTRFGPRHEASAKYTEAMGVGGVASHGYDDDDSDGMDD